MDQSRTKIILIGGFLGAGKTTLMTEAAKRLTAQGRTVGLITNDQGQGLVDTALVRRMNFAADEVAGGCFCCNLGNLMDSIDRLMTEVKPEIILAEPVGSCTDIVNAVILPLMLHKSDVFEIAPYTVLHNPGRNPELFSEDVQYLYKKQLEEADIIAVSRKDTLPEPKDESAALILEKLYTDFPGREVTVISAKTGDGVDKWLQTVLTQSSKGNRLLSLDYEVYTVAEAALGWLNLKGKLKGESAFSPTGFIVTLVQSLQDVFARRKAEIAHLKIYLSSAEKPENPLKASLTSATGMLSWDEWYSGLKVKEADFILNIRVPLDPMDLELLVRSITENTAEGMDISAEITDFECFSPAPPVKPDPDLQKKILTR